MPIIIDGRGCDTDVEALEVIRFQITQDDVLRGLHREATLTGDRSSYAARFSVDPDRQAPGVFVERRQQIGEDGQSVNSQSFTVSIVG